MKALCGSESIKRELDDLWVLRESYFDDEEALKEEMVNSRVESILRKANELKKEGRGLDAFARGRALDARLGFDPLAEIELSRAVKLCPNDVDAWNALGDVFWKKKDRSSAADCFRRACEVRANAVSYRSLSLLSRTDLVESVSLARSALSLDASNPESWYVLGNALVAKHFKLASSSRGENETRERKDLDDAFKAYGLAEVRLEKKKAEQSNRFGSLIYGHPDLHFNRGHLLAYLLDYPKAIHDFQKAHRLDPTLRAQETADDLRRFVKRCEDLVARRGGLKQKKRNVLLAKIPDDEKNSTVLEYRHQPDRDSAALLAKKTTESQDHEVTVDAVIALELRRSAQPPDMLLVLTKTNIECLALAVYDADTSSLTPGQTCTIKLASTAIDSLETNDSSVPLIKAKRHDDVILHSTKQPLPKSLRTQALCAAPTTAAVQQ